MYISEFWCGVIVGVVDIIILEIIGCYCITRGARKN